MTIFHVIKNLLLCWMCAYYLASMKNVLLSMFAFYCQDICACIHFDALGFLLYCYYTAFRLFVAKEAQLRFMHFVSRL